MRCRTSFLTFHLQSHNRSNQSMSHKDSLSASSVTNCIVHFIFYPADLTKRAKPAFCPPRIANRFANKKEMPFRTSPFLLKALFIVIEVNYYFTVALTLTDFLPTLIVMAFFLAFLTAFRVRVALPLAYLTFVSLRTLPLTVIVSTNAFFLF